MATNGLDEYWVPEHVKDYLRKMGFVLPLDDMEPWIRSWDDRMSARGDFYDYRDKDGMWRVYAVHRRSIHPAMRVCKEWGSLLLNEGERQADLGALERRPHGEGAQLRAGDVLGRDRARAAARADQAGARGGREAQGELRGGRCRP